MSGKKYKGSKIETPFFIFKNEYKLRFMSTTMNGSDFRVLGRLIEEDKLVLLKGSVGLDVVKKYLSDVKSEIFELIDSRGGICQISDLHPYVYYLTEHDPILDFRILDKVKKPRKEHRIKYEKKNKQWWYYPAVKDFFEKNTRSQIAIVICPLSLQREMLIEKIIK